MKIITIGNRIQKFYSSNLNDVFQAFNSFNYAIFQTNTR